MLSIVYNSVDYNIYLFIHLYDMISLKNVLSLVTLVAALFRDIRSEISDLNPPPNICLCVSIHNFNVRDSGL